MLRAASGRSAPRALVARLARDQRGAATIELAFVIGIMTYAMLCGADVAYFHVHRLQVESAAQIGAYAGSKACDNTQLPATKNCAGLAAAVAAGVQSSTLGSAVSVQAGYPSEGYYCVTTAGALQYVGTVDSPPDDCSAVGRASDQPADYLVVRTQYTHKPLFGTTFAAVVPTSIAGSAMVRLK